MRQQGAWVTVLVLGAATARADDALETDIHETAKSDLIGEHDGPWLKLDPVVRPNVAGLGAHEEAESTTFVIGPQTRAVIEGMHWTNDLDLSGRGWRAAVSASHDFGFARLTASASVNHIDTRFASGSYADIGVSLAKTFRLSRWMTGWISLSVGNRRWLGGLPPPGESDSTQVMLSIGTTFR